MIKDETQTHQPDYDAIDVMREKLIDMEVPGFQAEFDPDEAERAGAFLEDALSEQDALDGAMDATTEAS